MDRFSEIVGKDRIIVKLHPRTGLDRFTRRGYTVLPKEYVPWELYAMNEFVQNNVYLSNSSTAAITSKLVFGITTPCINLYKLDLLEKSLYTRQKYFPETYKLQESLFNHEEKNFFTPTNYNELQDIVIYLERRNGKTRRV